MSSRTIAAIATPVMSGGIGIIRISGDDAAVVADRVFRCVSGKKLSDAAGYTAHFGNIVCDGDIIDEAVATVFRAPKSYTGENVVELSVHGGTLLVKKVLRLVLDSGAHLADAGEFTRRAFMNGKLDLTQAESVMGLISAKSESELRLSSGTLKGRVSEKIENIRLRLTELAANVAVYADYPDEDLPECDPENFDKMLGEVTSELGEMLRTYDAGRILREGIETAIVGKPNVGKSTLMNLLSGTARSIVTDVAGTTRDVIEETALVGDITLRLADTAGIHDTEDTVEKIGVDLARQRLDTAELVLAVFDASLPLDKNDTELLSRIKDKKTIVVINKTDIGSQITADDFGDMRVVTVSAKTGDGYDKLCAAVAEVTHVADLSPDAAVLGSERQRDCAVRALSAAEFAYQTLHSGISIDAVGVCIDDALSALLELTGKRVTNEVADEVFRRFCVGK